MTAMTRVDLNLAHGIYLVRGLRFFAMRLHRRLEICAAAVVLALSLASPVVHAQALQNPLMREVPAKYQYLYKSAGAITLTKNASTQVSPDAKHIDLLSKISVTYNGIPDEEKPAIQAALNIWSDNWSSSVPVDVVINYVPLGTSGIIAAASPVNYFQNFKGAPDPTIYYTSAMANALAGKNLDPNNPQISINVNSTVANSLYLATDGKCPTNLYDLESIILHEMAHGLGFLSTDSYDPTSGFGTIDDPTPFDAFAQTPSGGRLMDLPSPSLALGQALQSPLVWAGANGIAANRGVKPLLYTPNPYQPGSSVSHLDESTFANDGLDALMTPEWPGGAVFHQLGPLVLGMLADMRSKPPAGIPAGIPDAPQNAFAIVADKSAIVSFDPPDNARTSLVSTYVIKVMNTGAIIQTTSSPVTITGLTNGASYTFSITATNKLGTSTPTVTNTIYPQAQWKSSVIDPTADAKYLAVTTFRGSPTILYTDSKKGDLKMAVWNGKTWVKTVVDGNSNSGGRTMHNVAGNVSVCTSAPGKNQRLDVVYPDLSNRQLRYAGYNGKSWMYTVVDGNGTSVLTTAANRTRTASDVSGANACVDTPDGLQIFYRDQSEGFILGAVQDGPNIKNWQYELVDGDRSTNGRTIGDVGFHLKAVNVGHKVYLLYDSVLLVNQKKQAIAGAVRLATRSSAYPEDWIYSTLDTNGGDVAVAGYDVALAVNGKDVSGTWMAASGVSLPNPNQLRWMDISNNGPVIAASTDIYGTPNAPLNTDGAHALFNCLNRLCAINQSDQTVALVTTSNLSSSLGTAWITVKGVRYALVGVGGKLQLFKAI